MKKKLLNGLLSGMWIHLGALMVFNLFDYGFLTEGYVGVLLVTLLGGMIGMMKLDIFKLSKRWRYLIWFLTLFVVGIIFLSYYALYQWYHIFCCD